jgi:hypothetical protein
MNDEVWVWKSAGRPTEPASTKDVKMNVKDRLPGVSIRVEHRAVPRVGDSFLASNLRRDYRESPHEVRICRVVQRGNVTARDHEHVDRRLWIDVAKRNAVLCFRDDGRWNFTPHDSAKEALVCHVIPPRAP